MSSLVLDLAVDPSFALRATEDKSSTRLLRLADLRRLGALGTLREIRRERFERCTTVVNDLRAQRKWIPIILLTLAARAKRREVVDPAGNSRAVTWGSLLAREIPFVIRRGRIAAAIRGRVRREIRTLEPAGGRRPVRPSRVVFFRADLSPALRAGGSVAHIQGVVSGFERLGCPVTFVTPAPVAGFEADGPRVRTIPQEDRFRLLPELPYLAYNETLLSRAIEILREVEADLVYYRHALGGYAAAAAARRVGLPLVVEFNGSEVWIARNWGHGLAHQPLFEEVERRGLQAADLIVAVSEPLRDQLREAGVPDDRILINPNGVDAARFDPDRLASRRQEIRRELGLGPDQLLAGFVGTFGPWHGAETLAEAICRLDEPWSHRMRFLFIGDGDRRAATEKILREGRRADGATFTGLLAQHETPAYLSACDLCVSPHVPNADGTAFFGSPTKLFEYLATGRPVLASDLGQIGEVLDHERNALLVPPGDVGALVDGLVRLAEDPALRERLGSEGVNDARARFSWTAHVQRILDRLGDLGTEPRS
jgi:glycosyltransferase involved in cell wall biosynthesis